MINTKQMLDCPTLAIPESLLMEAPRWMDDRLGSREKYLLIVLYALRDAWGEVFVTIDRLSFITGLSKSSVRRSMKVLVDELGFVQKTYRSRNPSRYTFKALDIMLGVCLHDDE